MGLQLNDPVADRNRRGGRAIAGAQLPLMCCRERRTDRLDQLLRGHVLEQRQPPLPGLTQVGQLTWKKRCSVFSFGLVHLDACPIGSTHPPAIINQPDSSGSLSNTMMV